LTVNTIQRNTGALLQASKEDDLEADTDKTNLLIANKSFKNVAKFICL